MYHLYQTFKFSSSCSDKSLNRFCGVYIDTLPEGLTRELPVADEYEKAVDIGSGEAEEEEYDLEDLKAARSS